MGYIGPGIPTDPVWPFVVLAASFLGLGRPGRWQPSWSVRLIGGLALATTIVAYIISSAPLLTASVFVAVINGLVGRWIIQRQYAELVKRLKHGKCLHCGYDLTGNTSGTCPECGKPSIKGEAR